MLFLFYSPSLSSVCLVCFNNYPICFKISYWIVSYLKSLLGNDSAYCGGISTFSFLHLFLWSKKIVLGRHLFQVLACKLSSHCYILMDNLPLKRGSWWIWESHFYSLMDFRKLTAYKIQLSSWSCLYQEAFCAADVIPRRLRRLVLFSQCRYCLGALGQWLFFPTCLCGAFLSDDSLGTSCERSVGLLPNQATPYYQSAIRS